MNTIPTKHIATCNERAARHLRDDYEHLGEQLARCSVDLERVKAQVAALQIALPSWGVGTGGTRFARFPGRGEPRDVFDKLQDSAVVHQLVRCNARCRCTCHGTAAAIGPSCAATRRRSGGTSTR